MQLRCLENTTQANCLLSGSRGGTLVSCTARVVHPFCPLSSAEWDEELVASLSAVADAKSGEDARKEIPALLSKLNDPFTRWLPPK